MIDDSSLFHGGYDPVKAKAYYERTKKLKGRKPGAGDDPNWGRKPAAAQVSNVQSSGGKPNRADTKSRQAQLEEQKAALKKRLDRLSAVLEELVAAAKKRSGGDPNKSKDEAGKAPETKVDKADRNKAEKDRKPETASQKKEKAKKAKDAYEKENPNSLSQDVDILKAQVADIQKKIQAALDDAAKRRKNAGKSTLAAPAQLVRPNKQRAASPLSLN